MELYVNKVDSICESVGLSHATDRSNPPNALCGASLIGYNWTRSPCPRTKLCKRCEALIQKQKHSEDASR